MVQNRLFQLLALTAMEPPIAFDADAVRDERLKVLNAIHPLSAPDIARDAVRAQDGSATDGTGAAYRNESGVGPDSRTETLVALKLRVDNWRWADVPFYRRTGKRLAARASEIVIQFRRAPFLLFRDTAVAALQPNQLVRRIQPDEAIALGFEAKVPRSPCTARHGQNGIRVRGLFRLGGEHRLRNTALRHDDRRFDAFSPRRHRRGRLESGRPDPSRVDDDRGHPAHLSLGKPGPSAADELLARDGREWRRPGR
jgi:glucose-6-phosphate 1-dehydrogenase